MNIEVGLSNKFNFPHLTTTNPNIRPKVLNAANTQSFRFTIWLHNFTSISKVNFMAILHIKSEVYST